MWKEISYEPNYEVSMFGQVRNKDTGHIKSLRLDRYGYQRVTLYPSGRTYTIHRLVADMFLKKTAGFNQVNHLDGDKENNHVENLEWCDASRNAHHRDTKLQSKWKGSLNPSAVLTAEDVIRIKYGDLSEVCNSVVAKIFNVKTHTITRIRNGDRWGHL